MNRSVRTASKSWINFRPFEAHSTYTGANAQSARRTDRMKSMRDKQNCLVCQDLGRQRATGGKRRIAETFSISATLNYVMPRQTLLSATPVVTFQTAQLQPELAASELNGQSFRLGHEDISHLFSSFRVGSNGGRANLSSNLLGKYAHMLMRFLSAPIRMLFGSSLSVHALLWTLFPCWR